MSGHGEAGASGAVSVPSHQAPSAVSPWACPSCCAIPSQKQPAELRAFPQASLRAGQAGSSRGSHLLAEPPESSSCSLGSRVLAESVGRLWPVRVQTLPLCFALESLVWMCLLG